MKQHKRTKMVVNTDTKKPNLLVMSELANRVILATTMGQQTYGGARDVFQALGYPNKLKFKDFYARYIRQDIAKALIDRPVKASWKGDIEIIENQEEEQTEFEKDWNDIYTALKLKNIFMRADKLTGLGRYSVLLLGTNDLKNIDSFKKPLKSSSSNKLVYVKPFSEVNAQIQSLEENVNNPRYGKPKYYKINVANTIQSATFDSRVALTQKGIVVHYTRVIHLTEDILENEIYGTPRLEVVFNRLIDLEKLIGGDAEMFWRGARPGYTGSVKEDYQMTEETQKDLINQINEFEHNLRRVLVNEGVDYKALEQQIADPSSHVDVQIQMLSAVSGVPKRILVGSERGELSSAQDKQEYIGFVTTRREEHNEPYLLRPVIDALIEFKIITPPKDDKYEVVWDTLFSLSDKEKAELGRSRAFSLKMYGENPVLQKILPIELFLRHVLGLDKIQIDEVLKELESEKEKDPIKMSDFEPEPTTLPKSISDQPVIEQEA